MSILHGKKSDSISYGKALAFTNIFRNKFLNETSFITIYPLFDFFPKLSQFSYRFGFMNRPHLQPCSVLSDIKIPKCQSKQLNPANEKKILPTLQWKKEKKLMRWRNDLTPINDRFFLTSLQVAKDGVLLKEHGITHIVNAASQVGESASGFQLLELPMNDGGNENILSYIFQFSEFVSTAGGKIAVHCIEGSSRSTSLLIGYYILTQKLSYDESLSLIRLKRRIAQPNPAFTAQLYQLYEVVAGTKNPTCFFSKEKQLNFEIQFYNDRIIARPFAKFINNRNGVFVSVVYTTNLFIGDTDEIPGNVHIIVNNTDNQDLIEYAKLFSSLLTKFLRCNYTG